MQRLTRFFHSARMRSLLNALQKLISVAAVVFLGVKLYHIGWEQLWAALPRHSSFYVTFAVLYITMPLAEVLIYSNLWSVGLKALPIFLRKRVYNEVVIDYSGEAYLYLWAKRILGINDGRILSTVKDVNLLSGVASNAVTLALVIAFALAGYATLLQGINPQAVHAVEIAASIAVAVMLAVMLFGRHLLGVTRKQAFAIGGIHFARMLLVLTLQVVMWGSALPEVPVSQWIMFLTAQMLLTRLPFLPNRDVMMMWLGVTLAPAIAAPQAHVASMFVAAGALSLLTHAVVFGATALMRQPTLDPETADPETTAQPA
jgi:hypothetical protein